MNRIIYILILCLSHFFSGYAQSDLFSRLPQEERDDFYENACHYIQNTYYYQIAEAITKPSIHKYLIEYLMASNEARYQPEAIPEASKQRLLSPSQYLMSLSHAFGKDSELEFSVSNFSYDNQVRPNPDNPLNCFIQVEYDLEVRQQNETLLKRRCRMCCLFPNPIVKTQVKTMQIEPLKDIFILASDDKRFNEAMQWYEQGLKEKAIPVFKALAEKGYTEAEWKYGSCLHDDKKYEEAVFWYRRAIQKNHAKAQNNLGFCYEYGEGVTKDIQKAVEWYTKAAKQGYDKAQCNLGWCYYTGEGVTKDMQKAVKWYTKAAEQGFARAQFNLGWCYEFGEGVPKDRQKAVEWYTKAAERYMKAAEQGGAEAQFALGLCYEFGKGVTGDMQKAVEWYTKAAGQGNAAAKEALERLSITENTYEPMKQEELNQQQAEEEIVILDTGEKWFSHQYETASAHYHNGAYDKAVPIFKELAENGWAQAQNSLGYCYSTGRGVSKDYVKAAEWYEKAAIQGNATAQFNLGACYESGKGVPQDISNAINWYSIAASQGNASAQCQLGTCYYYGKGVTQHYIKAIEWYTKAAKQGNVSAQYYLGICCEKGKGVPQNYTKAIEWYTKAANQGYVKAKESLERLQKQNESTCQGIIKDVNGKPMEGVSILVKGSRIGTLTDRKGLFLLKNVQPNNTLQFSYMNYPTYSIQWDGEFMNITLSPQRMVIQK